jgi:hypothetical protein
MTIRELSGLLARREAALDRQTHRLTLAEALANERVFGEADRAIVAELRRRNAPVRVGAVDLHLTVDRLSFVQIDPASGRPIGDHKSYRTTRTLLYRYPARPA